MNCMLSNGKHEAADSAQCADLKFFTGVVSVDNVKSFKPDPPSIVIFRESESTASEAWLVSNNPFDVIGATSASLQSAWVKVLPCSFLIHGVLSQRLQFQTL